MVIADDFPAIAAAMRALGLEGGGPVTEPAAAAVVIETERWEAARKEDAGSSGAAASLNAEEPMRRQKAMRNAMNSQLQQRSALALGVVGQQALQQRALAAPAAVGWAEAVASGVAAERLNQLEQAQERAYGWSGRRLWRAAAC